jgi:glycosyltransferase involved in cell wall biosynthesis
MPKILFIAIHRPFRSPSQRFRFDQFMEYFEAIGYDITYSSLINSRDDAWFYNRGHLLKKTFLILKSITKRIHDVMIAKEYDLVFVQREAIMLGTSTFERLLAKRSSLIYDFDDSIWLLDVSEANKKFSWLKKPKKTENIIRHSTAVFAGNEYLAHFAKKFNHKVFTIPTVLKTKDINHHYPTKCINSKVVIGWIGSTTTIKHLEWAQSMLVELFAALGNQIELIVISDKKPSLKNIDYTFIKWSPKTELSLLTTMDIGIMPIPDDNWTRGKCGFKGLQCMSYGIPVVMSSVGVNNQIIHHAKNGYLANTNQEWIQYITLLTENVELRQEIGTQGRKTVVEDYAVEKWQERIVSIFDDICAKN